MEYNILNGDCLKESLEGKYENLLIMREALMQGPIKEENENDFFDKRADFISQEYKACSKEQYLEALDEFDKIKNIKENIDINLWFGKDVFCQVNFWFLLNFLKNKIHTNTFYLVFPKENQDCSFSNEVNRKESFENKHKISKKEFELFCTLWRLFQDKEFLKMLEIAKSLETNYPFIKESIEAIINMKEVENIFVNLYKKENDFGKVFKIICKEYSIYGYGDLQVMYILGLIDKNLR